LLNKLSCQAIDYDPINFEAWCNLIWWVAEWSHCPHRPPRQHEINFAMKWTS
jgi:hypothetical protein